MLDRRKFDGVLAAVNTLVQANDCFVLLKPPFGAALEVRDRSPIEALAEQGISRAEREEAIADIAGLLWYALVDRVEEYVEYRMAEDVSGDVEAGDAKTGSAEEWTSRAGAVASTLVDDGLRSRYRLKRLSKAPAFTDIDWDVKVKVDDAGESGLEPFPYVTVKLKFQRDFGDEPFWLGGTTVDSVQVNFSTEELEYVIHSLQRSRDAMVRAQGRLGTWQ